MTKSILKEVLTISADPKICKDVGSELEFLDFKISTPTNNIGRAIFHEKLRHNSPARPRGAHADLQNVSNHDTTLTPVAQNPLYKTYPKARMSFVNWNLPTMSLREERTSRVLSLCVVDNVFEL